MPVEGSVLVTTAMFSMACRGDLQRQTHHDERAEAVRRVCRDTEAAVRKRGEEQNHAHRAEESKLLAENGEDVIVLRLGQEAMLLVCFFPMPSPQKPPDEMANSDCAGCHAASRVALSAIIATGSSQMARALENVRELFP